ncbi:hypothetical protein JCM19000A_25800 [Silvimonas sp. JCM 19000]
MALILTGWLLVSSAHAASAPAAKPWPHQFTVDGTTLTLYQPQLDNWQGNQLNARMAVAVKKGSSTGPDGKKHDLLAYGVAWVSAQTLTDKTARTVRLDNINVDKASFPTEPDNEANYLALIRKAVPQKTLVVGLDQLEASLAINRADEKVASVPVNNSPPQILFSFEPALLVLIDGEPALKPTRIAGVQRVINTRSLILVQNNAWYLYFAGHWATSSGPTSAWLPVKSVPAGLTEAMQQAVAAKLVDVMDKPPEAMKKTLAAGKYPDIYTATSPAELIMIDGEPRFEPIAGTNLAYISNTASDVIIDPKADGSGDTTWYVLLSGRWFSAPASKGPWAWVAGDKLPDDFLKIPSESAKGSVLASIPGTPEARESLIANSIPQTATVNRQQAHLSVSYDGGNAQFKPIDNTPLAYAWNTAVPVIRVTDSEFYAVQNGVWFKSPLPSGPWEVATSVPAVIYTIPPASPLHYVTYVRVYGSSGQVVYVGYTPGYYGTVVSGGTVVYGTGYVCDAWIGDVWYGCPATYGYNVAFGYDPFVGWTFGFVAGWAWASAWYGPYWGPWYGWYGPSPYYWGGGVAVGNVYGRWGNTVAQGTRAVWSNPWTGNYGSGVRGSFYNQATGGHGVGYAGYNTNAYTGTTTARAGGARYNPETGRIVAGQGGAAGNPWTGNAGAAVSKTTINTNTGRVTQSGGVTTRTNQGATAAGGFNTRGAGGDANGRGYVHYDASTGDVTHGGVVNANGNVYAGKDGNVYRYDKGDGWQKVQPDGSFQRTTPPADSNVDNDRLARDRSADRTATRSDPAAAQQRLDSARQNRPQQAARPAMQQPRFERGNYGGNFQGRMGGFRRFR